MTTSTKTGRKSAASAALARGAGEYEETAFGRRRKRNSWGKTLRGVAWLGVIPFAIAFHWLRTRRAA
jgi:hypothetical protein